MTQVAAVKAYGGGHGDAQQHRAGDGAADLIAVSGPARFSDGLGRMIEVAGIVCPSLGWVAYCARAPRRYVLGAHLTEGAHAAMIPHQGFMLE